MERLQEPEKNWKFSIEDTKERQFWNDYMKAYEDTVRYTATKEAPWYVVPADKKWFTRMVVASAIIDAMASLDLKYPKLSADKLREISTAKSAL
jgi:polyphosphate kinase 2 (PPK2 family)